MNNIHAFKFTALAALVMMSLPSLAAGPVFVDDVFINNSNPDLILGDNDANEADWWLQGDDPCNECFGIGWANGIITTPFVIESDTANNLLYLDSAERIGINTSVPGYTVDAVGNRIRLRNGSKSVMMRVDGAVNDLEATGADLFIKSTDGNIRLNPFTGDGNVGVGTVTPSSKLHVGSGSDAQLMVENTTATTGTDRFMFKLVDPSASKIRFSLQNAVGTWSFDTTGINFQINRVGTGLTEFRVESNGDINARGRSFAVNHINTSTRAVKTDFAPVDEQAVLEKLAALPIGSWRYKTEAEETRHIGPVAEDFQQVFGLSDGVHISTVDANGVALVAIRELNRMLKEKEAEIKILNERITRMESLLIK